MTRGQGKRRQGLTPPGAAGPWQRYRVAGRSVALDCRPPALAPYRVDGPEPARQSAVPEPVAAPAARAAEVEGLLGGELQRVLVAHDGAGSWLEIPGVVALWVAADGTTLRVTPDPGASDDARLEESILGPGLILALARQGTYCLHASAVEVAGRAVAFVGDSGAGKSTLAALLDGHTDGHGAWRRVADDILPVASADGLVVARPDFPQLKLAAPLLLPDELAAGPRLPLAGVYELVAAPADPFANGADAVTVRTLPPNQAAITLLSHLVAARLFPETLRRRQLADLIAWIDHVPVRQLVYPHRPDIGPAVALAIAAELTASAGSD
jgi:hypothetical protein